MELFDDFSTLFPEERHGWRQDLYRLAEGAFRDQDDSRRLLGNLLVMERYLHTLEQGLAEKGEEPLSPGLRQGVELLWDCLEGRVHPLEFQDFANSLDACVFAHNVGDREDAPQSFWEQYLGDTQRTAYEWLALEWAACLLLQLVSIAGGEVDDPEKEGAARVDFYGVCNMLDLLENACSVLAGPVDQSGGYRETADRVHATPLFQGLVAEIQNDLKTALTASSDQYAAFREEYRSLAILPEKYAAPLLDY